MSCHSISVKFINSLKRESARGPPYGAGEKKFFPLFIILNDRSRKTIVKSKISKHLVTPMKKGTNEQVLRVDFHPTKWVTEGCAQYFAIFSRAT